MEIEERLEKVRCFIVEDKIERAKKVVSQYQVKLSSCLAGVEITICLE